MARDVYRFTTGTAPLLMSIPHVGTGIPDDIKVRLTPPGVALMDTDWHLDRLYDFAAALGLSVLRAIHSRYVIDLNRSPDGRELYPGANNTELVPTTTFSEAPLYRGGAVPDEAEIDRRRSAYWQPYHDRLSAALDGIKREHGVAVLFDCHSIRSHVPRFFDGALPDFNLGTGGGTSCDPGLRERVAAALAGDDHYSLAVDGRFKGGYITRQYGRPDDNIHAFQLELSLATYMEEDPPFTFRDDLANRVRPSLRRMLETALDWAEGRKGKAP